MAEYVLKRRVLLGAIAGFAAIAGCADEENDNGDDVEEDDIELEGYRLRSSAERTEENTVRCWLSWNAERHVEARDQYDTGESNLASEQYEQAEEVLLESADTFEEMRDEVEAELEQTSAEINEELFEELREYLDEMATGAAFGVVGAREGMDGNHGEAQELLDALQTRRDVAQDHLREVEDEIGRDWEPVFDFDCVPEPAMQIQLWLDDRLDRIEAPARGFSAGHEAFAQGEYGTALAEFETAEDGFEEVVAEAEHQLDLIDEAEDPELFELFELLAEFLRHTYESASYGVEAAEAAEADDMEEAEELYAESQSHANDAEEYMNTLGREVDVTL